MFAFNTGPQLTRCHLLAVFLWFGISICPAQVEEHSNPNIIFILVDDMGYSDIGCYGGEVQTPHLDQMAGEGMRFTSMYNTAKCFPSRACLLTGLYAQQCNMWKSSTGGIKNAITLGELLRTAGYRTLAVGKHHSSVSLYDRGFDRFYGFFYGPGKSCANHFNPGEQRPGEGVPARKKNENRAYCFDDKLMVPYYTPEERDWYTTDTFTKWALSFLEEYKNEDKPYFLYLSYTAPHDPLHAWPEDIDKYKGVYEAGYESIRNGRFKRMKEMGLIGSDVQLSESTFRSWSSLSAAQKKDQARRMQVYAAMIDRVDQNIGKLLEKIRELGQEENTLILFASDNGCSAENVNAGSGEVGSLTRWSSVQKDWANVSNTPFRYWKNLSHEGGIRTPFIAYWPGVIHQEGAINHHHLHFIDVMATLQDITGAAYPSTFAGNPIPPIQGESFLPLLKGESMPERSSPLFWQYRNSAAIRDGKWKLVTNSIKEPSAWELFDMTVDPTETENLSGHNPEMVEHLKNQWERWFEGATGNSN
ncbi:MAG: arylsulfatase [Puniceicoccaceae bacterium]